MGQNRQVVVDRFRGSECSFGHGRGVEIGVSLRRLRLFVVGRLNLKRRPYDNEGVLTRGTSAVLPAFFGVGLCQSLSKTKDCEEDHETGQNGTCSVF